MSCSSNHWDRHRDGCSSAQSIIIQIKHFLILQKQHICILKISITPLSSYFHHSYGKQLATWKTDHQDQFCYLSWSALMDSLKPTRTTLFLTEYPKGNAAISTTHSFGHHQKRRLVASELSYTFNGYRSKICRNI